jgi:glycosyltransferase involved in cell wall biosynthesis
VGELVRDGVEGVAVAPEPAELAAVLARLLNDEKEWQRLSRNAVARAAGYDWDAIAQRIEAICLALIGGAR